MAYDGDTSTKFQMPGFGQPDLGDYIQFTCDYMCDVHQVYMQQYPTAGNRFHKMSINQSLDNGVTWFNSWGAVLDTNAQYKTLYKPTQQPTSTPTLSSVSYAQQRASPTYSTKNEYAYAVVADVSATGLLVTWGEAKYGGNSSTVTNLVENSYVAGGVSRDSDGVVATRFAFAARIGGQGEVSNGAGGVVAWGLSSHIAGWEEYSSIISNKISALNSNEGAFAGIDDNVGAVIAFGMPAYGGNVIDDRHCNGYAHQLSSDVVAIAATSGAFAALKNDRSVYAWGFTNSGGGTSSETLSSLTDVVSLYGTRQAFAALKVDGSVVTWGSRTMGGDSSAVAAALARDVVHIVASPSAFVAFKRDSSIVVWGYHKYGGDASSVAGQLSSGVKTVYHTAVAFAALKSDNSVVTWGKADGGGDSSAVQSQLKHVDYILGSQRAFAALTLNNTVVAWGAAAAGGSIPAGTMNQLTAAGVSRIWNNDMAFVAETLAGNLVCWGAASHGGDCTSSTSLQSQLVNVSRVVSNAASFSMIRNDGTVVAWGHSVSVSDPGIQFQDTVLIGVHPGSDDDYYYYADDIVIIDYP
mmetsp:Transcript_9076/g.15043  ORF Transcript_9076/g.15043 Transcript_9076/m.15043 type:complete len:580 (-) Transcript_9076:206-1945(-)